MLMEGDDLRFLRRAIAIAQHTRSWQSSVWPLLVGAHQQLLLEAENNTSYAVPHTNALSPAAAWYLPF